MKRRFINYLRVSTSKQGIDGNGIQAQEEAIRNFLRPDDEVIATFREVQSGGDSSRAELAKAIQLTKKHKAILLVSKVDRLSRSANLIFQLRESGVRFMAADNEFADNFTVNLWAILAEREKEIVGLRTRAGMQAAAARGVVMGNPNAKEALKSARRAISERANRYCENILPVVRQIQGAGVVTLQGIADVLNVRGFTSPRGSSFTPQTVKNVLARG